MKPILVREVGMIQYGKQRHRTGIWECPKCGNNFQRTFSNMKRGTPICSQACRNTTHGLNKADEAPARILTIWRNMKARCYNKNIKKNYRYWSRGIKVCEEWLRSFESFKEWAMKNGYSEDLTIDRINNDGDYTPENCRWTNYTVQANNRGTRVDSRFVEKFTKYGEFITSFESLADAAKSINPSMVPSISGNIMASIKRDGLAYGYKWTIKEVPVQC